MNFKVTSFMSGLREPQTAAKSCAKFDVTLLCSETLCCVCCAWFYQVGHHISVLNFNFVALIHRSCVMWDFCLVDRGH